MEIGEWLGLERPKIPDHIRMAYFLRKQAVESGRLVAWEGRRTSRSSALTGWAFWLLGMLGFREEPLCITKMYL